MDLNAFVWGLVGGFILLLLIILNILFFCMRRNATKKSQAQYKNSHLPAYLPEVTANDSSNLK